MGMGWGVFSYHPCVSGTFAHQEAFPMVSPGLQPLHCHPQSPRLHPGVTPLAHSRGLFQDAQDPVKLPGSGSPGVDLLGQ